MKKINHHITFCFSFIPCPYHYFSQLLYWDCIKTHQQYHLNQCFISRFLFKYQCLQYVMRWNHYGFCILSLICFLHHCCNYFGPYYFNIVYFLPYLMIFRIFNHHFIIFTFIQLSWYFLVYVFQSLLYCSIFIFILINCTNHNQNPFYILLFTSIIWINDVRMNNLVYLQILMICNNLNTSKIILVILGIEFILELTSSFTLFFDIFITYCLPILIKLITRIPCHGRNPCTK